jgi:ABC-2 type transport system permease protein
VSAVFHSWLMLIRRSKTGLIAILIGLALFEFIQPVAIRSFGDLSRWEAIITLVPEPFLAMMNVTPEFLTAVGLPGYLSLGFTHPAYHILAAAAVIWFAGRSLAGEMEHGSIQLALSRPLSRSQVYLARVIGYLTVTFLVAVFAPLGMIAGLIFARPDGTMEYRNFIAQAAATALLTGCIGGVALLISAASDRMGQAVGLSIGLLVVSYVIDYFAALWTALEPLEPFSIFDYYDPAQALSAGTIPWMNVVVLGGLTIIGIGAGAMVFHRRDLPV